ncbi:hypothetical protein HPB50_001278 [Hyalomma asiaticum]|uniref:Uncharacterized protein n=1 Tax=Hyalomma asiaticum TaxID=266040 RepID=A0ACB7RNQ5_HYAAI|nr:hypothetical protein HPB50_001278 [Hyalomma asiaticum]
MNHEGAAMMAGERSRPVEPLVPFKVQPFYTVMAQLVRPRKLTTTGNSVFQSKSFKFMFEAQHVNEIRSSLTRNAAGIHEFKVQVHLRFRLLDASPEQEDSYPSDLAVVVNGRYIELPKPVHSNVPGKAGLPINIVFSCLVSHQAANTVRVEWCPVLGQEFAVGVFLVRKLSVRTLLALIRHRSVQQTREMVKQKLKLRACDDNVSIPSYHVSLLCPLSKARITLPCRADSCTHLECFDAFNYLQINEETPRWLARQAMTQAKSGRVDA